MNILFMKDTYNINIALTRYLKSKIVAKGKTYQDVVMRLNEEGIKCTESSFTTKLNRGTFSASFFIQCLAIIGEDIADVKDIVHSAK